MRGTASSAVARRHSVATAAALAALALALIGLLAPAADAAPEATRTYKPGAFFGGQGSDPGQFSDPSQIAVEPTSGNLLVTDTANGRVQVLAPDAEGDPGYLTTLGAGTIVTPVGIAVDQASGAIYVSDSGAGEIFRFTSDGAATPTYTLDAAFTSPVLSSYASPLAIDPSTHDLLVADTGSQEVRRFDVADGKELDSFNGADSPGGQFTSLRSLAVAASGTIYVVDDLFPEAIYYAFGAGRTESFDAEGDSLGQLQDLASPGAVGFDPGSGRVIVGEHNHFEHPPKQLALFEAGASPASVVAFPSSVEGGSAAIAASPLDPFALFVLVEMGAGQFGVPGIEPFTPADIPAAEIGAAPDVEATTAHLTGSVAPGTLSGTGTARFEYSLDGTTWSTTPEQAGIAGPGAAAVSAELSDLRPNSTYSARLRVENEDFSATSDPITFATAPVAPLVVLTPPTDRRADSVVLRGMVNPAGQQTSYHFEYGTSAAYGSSSPIGAEDVAGGGYEFRSAAASLTDLAPSSTYHYRLLARNATGTNASPDATFTTRAASEPSRAYEQVTPVDKGGALLKHGSGFQARASGDGLVYATSNAMYLPEVGGAPLVSQYVGRRSAAGWEQRSIDPPQDSVRAGEVTGNTTLAVSADHSHALVVSNQALAPGALEGAGNYYRRDLSSGAYEWVATSESFPAIANPIGRERFYGGSPDFSVIYLKSPEPLTPEATPFFEAIYEWSAAQGVRLLSPVGGWVPSPSRNNWPARTLVSDDGYAYFSVQFSAADDGIYRARDGASERILDPGVLTMVADVTPDGRYLTYIDQSSGNLYRYETASGDSELIFTNTSAGGTLGYMGMSNDGSTIVDVGDGGSPVVWHEGETTPIGHAPDPDGVINRGLMISPNGRYVVFSSISLADQPYDNSGCAFDPLWSLAGDDRCFEVYVYDTELQKLDCASCPSDGARSSGHAHLGPTTIELSLYARRHVGDAGQVLFDTPSALVAADTNGARDVYLYQDGEVQLISPGTGNYNAHYADASADFGDVFFITDQPLVGQDSDNFYDVYDARLGGGLPSQAGAGGGTAPCTGTDCRAPVPTAPLPSSPASEHLAGDPPASGERRTRAHHPKKGKRKARKRRSKHKGKAGPPGSRRSAQAAPAPEASNRNLGK